MNRDERDVVRRFVVVSVVVVVVVIAVVVCGCSDPQAPQCIP
jgi:hypothetical protein